MTRIIIETPGDLDDGLRLGREIYDGAIDIMHVRVEDTDDVGCDGVFCHACDGQTTPGVLWPATPDEKDDRPYVMRCDTCERYDSDLDAADAVRDSYAGAAEVTVGVTVDGHVWCNVDGLFTLDAAVAQALAPYEPREDDAQ